MAQRLQAAAGPGAHVARVGGDELLAVLPPDGPAPEAVGEAVAGAVVLSGAPVELRVRAGYGAAGDGEAFAPLLRRAHAALARAADDGTRYRAWSQELAVDPTRRLRLAGDLRVALADGQVRAVFQPLCRAGDAVVVGAEALARWRHPELGPVPPDEFVAIAEQTGLVTELLRVVLDDALAQARVWWDGGAPLRVSVNLSARSLPDPGLLELVARALDRLRPAGRGTAARDHREQRHGRR